MGGHNIVSMSGEERQYGTLDFWKTRYSKDGGEPFEWLQSYELIQGLVNEQFSNKSARVLNVGCGRSNLVKEMYRDGYSAIEGVDWVPHLIRHCNDDNPNIKFVESPVSDLDQKSEAGSIQYVIDKGLLDSILCGANSTQNAYTYLMQVKKCLLPGGKFIIISHGPPKKREEHLTRKSLGMSLENRKFSKPEAKNVNPTAMGMSDAFHYAYILTNSG